MEPFQELALRQNIRNEHIDRLLRILDRFFQQLKISVNIYISNSQIEPNFYKTIFVALSAATSQRFQRQGIFEFLGRKSSSFSKIFGIF